MEREQGYVAGVNKMLDNGSSASRFNVVLVAEGYGSTELDKFHEHARSFIDRLFAVAPFSTIKPVMNIYRIDVSSPDRGAEVNGNKTFFNAAFSEANAGLPAVLSVDVDKVLNVVNGLVPRWHQVLVIVNSKVRGRTGGPYPIAATSVGSDWELRAVNALIN